MNAEGLSQQEQEKLLLKQLFSGDLKLNMHGKKIKGTYALFRLKKEEKSWLLVKKDDKYATEEEVVKKNKSVQSGKTLAQIATQNGVEVKHPEEDAPKPKTRSATTRTKKIASPKKTPRPASKAPRKKKLLK
jgi:bifunctional non-homologous end joining protein LigD